jgi:hypothetical protein
MNENSELPKSTVNAAILAGCIIAFLGFGFFRNVWGLPASYVG